MDDGELFVLPAGLEEHDYCIPHVDHIERNIKKKEVNQVAEKVKEMDQNAQEKVSLNEDLGKNIGCLPETYTIIPGVRYRSRIYVDNLGFKYYKRDTHRNRIYLVCAYQKNASRPFCPCNGSISTNQMNNTITVRFPHNHEPSEIDWDVSFLREEISTVGIHESTVSLRTIYNNAIALRPVAAANYTYDQAKSRLKRMRQSRRLQKSLPINTETIENYEIIEMDTSKDSIIEHIQESEDQCQNINKMLMLSKKKLSNKRKKMQGNTTVQTLQNIIENISKNDVTQKSTKDCNFFGELIANKLEQFDDHTRLLLQHQINNIVLNAESNHVQHQQINNLLPSTSPVPFQSTETYYSSIFSPSLYLMSPVSSQSSINHQFQPSLQEKSHFPLHSTDICLSSS